MYTAVSSLLEKRRDGASALRENPCPDEKMSLLYLKKKMVLVGMPVPLPGWIYTPAVETKKIWSEGVARANNARMKMNWCVLYLKSQKLFHIRKMLPFWKVKNCVPMARIEKTKSGASTSREPMPGWTNVWWIWSNEMVSSQYAACVPIARIGKNKNGAM